jgi:hypothetical protein
MDHRRPLPRQIRALRIAVRGEGGEGHYSEASEELHYPCDNRGCHGGGLDLYAKVREMAEGLETRFRGEMSCQGYQSMGRYTELPSRVHRRHLHRVRRFMIPRSTRRDLPRTTRRRRWYAVSGFARYVFRSQPRPATAP